MAKPVDQLYDDLIEWQFTVEEQGFQARYGTSRGFYYKQVLIQGRQLPQNYPPKRVDKRVYELALRLHRGG